MKPSILLDEAKNLRAELSQFVAFLTSIEKLQRQITEIESIDHGAIDAKIGAEYAAAKLGLELAQKSKPRRMQVLTEAIGRGTSFRAQSEGDLCNKYLEIDAGIMQSVMKSVPDDLRGSVKPELSKVFLAEKNARLDMSSSGDYYGTGASAEELQRAADGVATLLEKHARESDRVTGVAKKFGVAA